MAGKGIFRTSLFGGFDKAEVEEYIRTLEREIQSVKALHQKEKADLLRKAEDGRRKAARAEAAVRLQAENKKLKKLFGEEFAKKQEEIARWQKEAAKQQEKAARWKEEAQKRQGTEPEEGKEISMEDYRALQKENSGLRERIQKMQAKLEQLKEKEEGMSDFFDYETVSKILKDANRNAEIIEKEAKARAEEMLEQTRVETEKQKEIITARINAQLEEKGIQLFAAKYKIEQYLKEIENAQQGLYDINFRMKKMVNNMPVRLDDYWEGEHYRELENAREIRGENALP